MTRLTLCLLVDALRHDYVDRTRCIRQLAESGRRGALREDFGFVPRAAYFGGLSPSQAGFTNMFCCDPAASPFGMARGLPRSRHGRVIEEPLGVRQWIETEARKRLTPYAASYVTTAEIPIDLLPYFDLSEKRAPWDPRVGYRSIFHELEDRGLQYYCCAWPGTTQLSDTSDAAIVSATLGAVEPPIRFAFVHLQALDSVGHAYGPESTELQTALDATDALVDSLLGTLRARFDRVDLVLFGDHGMVPVTGTVDVPGALAAHGLSIGPDLIGFLDSTMARFWPADDNAASRLTRALESLPGRVLAADDLQRLGLDGCDRRNGELIFLAHPGVLILPNFFQRRGKPVRGMHGYDPDCPDNRGAFIVHAPDVPVSAAGIVGPTGVHEALIELLGLRASRRGMPATHHTNGEVQSRFTQHPNPAADALVAAHMDRLVEAARTTVRDAVAIILTGSFGRGEGGIATDRSGELRPVNDYDVLVIAPSTPDTQTGVLRDCGEALAAGFGIDFVHFCVWGEIDRHLPISLAHFDIEHGSRVLWGPPDVLEALPRFAAASIPLFEGAQLLFNRLAGILTAFAPAPPRRDQRPLPRGAGYLRNQVMKALMAIGDWHLLQAGAYSVSYRVRRERFAWLAPGLGIARAQRDLIDAAYQYKLVPDSVPSSADPTTGRVARYLIEAIVAAMSAVTGRPLSSPIEAAAEYYALTTMNPRTVAADNAFASRTLAGDAVVRVQSHAKGSVRQSIYSSIPLVAAASLGDRDAFAAASTQLQTCLTPPWPETLTDENWHLLNRRVSHAWLTLVH